MEAWIGNLERYGGLFYRLAGKLESLRQAGAAAAGLGPGATGSLTALSLRFVIRITAGALRRSHTD